MAKFKKTASKKTAGSRASADDLQAQAEKLSKTLSESAQQIWLAGVGAFGRAQAEGTKLFEGLVKEGLNRSEEHTSELQSLMRISYAVFCLKKTKNKASKRHRHKQTRL